jgi:hypothetical protein
MEVFSPCFFPRIYLVFRTWTLNACFKLLQYHYLVRTRERGGSQLSR